MLLITKRHAAAPKEPIADVPEPSQMGEEDQTAREPARETTGCPVGMQTIPRTSSWSLVKRWWRRHIW